MISIPMLFTLVLLGIAARISILKNFTFQVTLCGNSIQFIAEAIKIKLLLVVSKTEAGRFVCEELLFWEITKYPSNTRCLPNVGSMLGSHRRRWTNIEPALGQTLLFAG